MKAVVAILLLILCLVQGEPWQYRAAAGGGSTRRGSFHSHDDDYGRDDDSDFDGGYGHHEGHGGHGHRPSQGHHHHRHSHGQGYRAGPPQPQGLYRHHANAYNARPQPSSETQPAKVRQHKQHNWGTTGCGKPAVKQVKNPPINDEPEEDRILGGTEARPHSHPWIVSIGDATQMGQVMKQIAGTSHSCGGTLIAPDGANQTDIVVTAGHCVYEKTTKSTRKPSEFTVTVGAHNLDEAEPNRKTVKVAEIRLHPKYSPDIGRGSLDNDISMLKLAEPVKFTREVKPACLPDHGEQLAEGTILTVAGWGARVDTKSKEKEALVKKAKSVGHDLQQLGVKVMNIERCNKVLKSNKDPRPVNWEENICAGGGANQDACQADSGGPLVAPRGKDGAYVLQGVVSWGKGCGKKGQPGVYNHVASYVDWINEQANAMSSV